jgi:hypothetical protein
VLFVLIFAELFEVLYHTTERVNRTLQGSFFYGVRNYIGGRNRILTLVFP